MKAIITILGILGVVLILILSSCTNSEKRTNSANEKSTNKSPLSVLNESDDTVNEADAILTTYLYLKDALVNDETDIVAEAAHDLSRQLKDFESNSYEETDQERLNEIMKEAAKQAQIISESSIDVQRKHFYALSNDMIDLIEITGTTKKLYQVYCPKYNNDKGAQWLSDYEEIKNPYFGNEMMNCGEILKEIN